MRAFVDTLRDVRDGELLAELPRKLQEVVEAVQATKRKGKFTISFELSMGKGGVLMVTDDVKQVIPEPDKDTTTVFFITEESDLSRRDPRQPKLTEMGVVRNMPPVERAEQSNG